MVKRMSACGRHVVNALVKRERQHTGPGKYGTLKQFVGERPGQGIERDGARNVCCLARKGSMQKKG